MSFICPRCGAVSHHPKDEEYGYCGVCHDFTGKLAPDAPLLSQIQRTPPLTEGMVDKGGRNQGPSQITERPPPPGAIPSVPSGTLPCDVHLPPNTYLRKGVDISTLMMALEARRTVADHATVFAEETEGGLRNALDDAHQIIDKIEDTRFEQLTVAMRHASDMRAIDRWRQANPGNDLVWPDRTDLVVWLMEQYDTEQRLGRVDASLAHRLGENLQREARFRQEIEAWLKAYSLDIFTKPDLGRAAELLRDGGMILDNVSADIYRHALTRVLQMLDAKDDDG